MGCFGGLVRVQKLFNYMSRPQNSCRTLLQPRISLLGPQKLKNDPKIETKSIVRIERKTNKMKVVQLHE